MTYISRKYTNAVTGVSSATETLQLVPLGIGHLVVMCVGTGSTSKTVSSIAPVSGSGTFTRVGYVNASTQRLELWIGYGFSEYPSNFTITFSTSSGSHSISGICIATSSGFGSAPTITPNAGSTGTSTTVDTGLVTPVSGDLLLAAGLWANGNASSARTPTGTIFIYNRESSYSSTYTTGVDFAQAASTTPSGLSWTVTSANWAAIAATITLPADMSTATGMLYKGRITAELDQAATV